MRMTRDRTIAFLVILPSIILLAIFVYFFIVQTAYWAMTDWQGMSANPVINFVGLKNFESLFTGTTDIASIRFRQGVVNNLFFTALFLTACLSLGLLLAILLDQKIRFEGVFRTIFLMPMALSFVVTGTVWRWLFSPRSGLNTLPTVVGLPALNAQRFPWFTDRRALVSFPWGDAAQVVIILVIAALLLWAFLAWRRRNVRSMVITGIIGLSLFGYFFLGNGIQPLAQVRPPATVATNLNLAIFSIVLAATWQMSGYTMAMYLAGLRGIPEELREAARVDGCTELGVYRNVVLPLLAPITLSAVIILGHISLKIFDLIYVMAGGDNLNVDVPGIHMYLTAFRGNNLAVGSAIATIMLIMVAFVIVPYLVNTFRAEARR